MREVEASKAPLSDPLDEAESGETVVITREGRPVARLVIDGADRDETSVLPSRWPPSSVR